MLYCTSLKGRVTERDQETEGRRPSALPGCCSQLGWARMKTGAWNSAHTSQGYGTGPSTWAILEQVESRALGLKPQHL